MPAPLPGRLPWSSGRTLEPELEPPGRFPPPGRLPWSSGRTFEPEFEPPLGRVPAPLPGRLPWSSGRTFEPVLELPVGRLLEPPLLPVGRVVVPIFFTPVLLLLFLLLFLFLFLFLFRLPRLLMVDDVSRLLSVTRPRSVLICCLVDADELFERLTDELLLEEPPL